MMHYLGDLRLLGHCVLLCCCACPSSNCQLLCLVVSCTCRQHICARHLLAIIASVLSCVCEGVRARMRHEGLRGRQIEVSTCSWLLGGTRGCWRRFRTWHRLPQAVVRQGLINRLVCLSLSGSGLRLLVMRSCIAAEGSIQTLLQSLAAVVGRGRADIRSGCAAEGCVSVIRTCRLSGRMDVLVDCRRDSTCIGRLCRAVRKRAGPCLMRGWLCTILSSCLAVICICCRGDHVVATTIICCGADSSCLLGWRLARATCRR